VHSGRVDQELQLGQAEPAQVGQQGAGLTGEVLVGRHRPGSAARAGSGRPDPRCLLPRVGDHSRRGAHRRVGHQRAGVELLDLRFTAQRPDLVGTAPSRFSSAHHQRVDPERCPLDVGPCVQPRFHDDRGLLVADLVLGQHLGGGQPDAGRGSRQFGLVDRACHDVVGRMRENGGQLVPGGRQSQQFRLAGTEDHVVATGADHLGDRVDEDLGLRGQLDAAPGLAQQRGSGFLLQEAELLGNCGRGEVEGLGDGGQGAPDGEFAEQDQAADLEHGNGPQRVSGTEEYPS